MRFTAFTAAFLALASRVLAQTDGFDAMTKPTKGEVINAGSTYQITWDYNAQYAGTISITLLEGDTPTTLELGDTFASGIDNSVGSYSWAVDSSLGDDATYGLKISLDSDSTIFQYSFPFSIAASSEGGSSSSTSISTISTISTSTSSSASLSSTSSPSAPSTTSTHSSVSSSASNTEATSSETSPSETSSAGTASSESTSPTVTSTGSTKSAASTGVTKTTLSSVVSGSSTGSATTSTSSPIVTAGAGKVVAGTFAAMGGFAAALLAL